MGARESEREGYMKARNFCLIANEKTDSFVLVVNYRLSLLFMLLHLFVISCLVCDFATRRKMDLEISSFKIIKHYEIRKRNFLTSQRKPTHKSILFSHKSRD